jgi:hypothetical protein
MLRYIILKNDDTDNVIIFNEKYDELFNYDLTDDEVEIFLKIICNNKDCLLYLTHVKFSGLCHYILDNDNNIYDGTIYP